MNEAENRIRNCMENGIENKTENLIENRADDGTQSRTEKRAESTAENTFKDTYRKMPEPLKRSAFRLKCGRLYYALLRKAMWLAMNKKFASVRETPLPCLHFSHRTILLRKLKDVDMQYQYNKIINLKLAAKQLNGIVLHPGEIFSYWKLIGKPSCQKGYVDGMVLQGGTFHYGPGGGLCQMSNLIYWMVLHTPLTVIERHRHGYDVFPDSNRTQPFGSGATCFYPHGDLMIRNDTDEDFQFLVWLDEEYLNGEVRAASSPALTYKILEKNHVMRSEFWGGFSRHNELYRQVFDNKKELLREELIVENHALMMYSPFLGG